MNKIINRYYLTTFISEFARTVPHPVLIILLIDQKTLTLSEITFIQIFFYLGVLLFEIPSGYLADRGYRKSTYVFSFIAMLIAYTIIYMSNAIPLLCIGWFIYGIAGAMTSGNIDGYIVNQLKQNHEEHSIKPFNIKRTNVSLAAGICGALTGSILYPLIGVNIYLISLTLYIISIVYCILMIKVKHIAIDKVPLKLKEIKWSDKLKLILGLICVIELYFVGFYQYWQVLYESKNISTGLFGVIYIIFSLTVILSNRVYGKLTRINNKIVIPVFLISALLSIVWLDDLLFTAVYPLTLFIANLYVIDLYTSLYKVVDEESISSVISIVSSANRLFGIAILAVLSLALNYIALNILLICLYLSFALIFSMFYNRLN